MKRFILNIKVLIIISVILLVSGCSATRKLSDDQILLKKNKISIKAKGIDKNELKSFIRPKANRKFMGFKFHLFLYNMSGNSDKGMSKWLKSIGEAPVEYNRFNVDKSKKQIRMYLAKKGYFNAEVLDTVIIKRRRAKVLYKIYPGVPYRLNNINFNIPDTLLSNIVVPDTTALPVKRGDVFDEDKLQEAVTGIENRMRNEGYYFFKQDYVTMLADSAVGGRKINLDVRVSDPKVKLKDERILDLSHRKYIINNIRVYMGYEHSKALSDSTYFLNPNTVEYRGITFYWLNKKKPPVNKKIVEQSIAIKKGDYCRKDYIEQTNRTLNRLGVYKYVNIEFEDITIIDSTNITGNDDGYLDCNIYLTPRKTQKINFQLEGTNTDGEFGMAGIANFQHRNIFKGAELLNLKVRGAFEGVKKFGVSGFNTAFEFGGELSLTTARFLLPGNSMKFIRKFRPKTTTSVSYYYQRRPNYTRAVSNLSFGYTWRPSSKITHTLNPIEYYNVELRDTTSEFTTMLQKQPYLRTSYVPHAISLTSYTFTYNGQDLRKNRNFIYFRFNTELAGNILSGINSLAKSSKTDGKYTLLGIAYSQFAKAEMDFRYNQHIGQTTSVVYRLFAGIGIPYGNSESLPFEKRYFSGGSQGVRGWQVRALGPGSYVMPEDIRYPDQTADIRLQFNFEYRYKIFKTLEGAFFVDVGNIWDLEENKERVGAVFKWDKFYNDLAVASGIGIRLNFNVFIIRGDFGFKLRDPAMQTDSKWILGNRSYGYDDWAFHVGIGYPF